MFDFIVLIPLFPLFGAFLNGIYGVFRDKWANKPSHTIGVAAIGLAFGLVLLLVYKMLSVPIVLLALVPALGAFLNFIFGYRWSDKLVSVIGVGSVGISFVLSALAFWKLIHLEPEARFIEVVFYKCCNDACSYRRGISYSCLLDWVYA
jgi:NADH:ubiquinone oxidoreductase subunit 5 (subunit L)/multisubunit Na+/H+ antiporter MnhA subunit